MTRVAVATTGLELTWEALQSKGWNEEQLAAMQRCWESQDFLSGLEKGMEGERSLPLAMLAAWHDRNNNRPGLEKRQHSLEGKVRLSSVMENDVLFALRHLHAEVELARELRQGRAFGEVMTSFREIDARLERKAKSLTRIFYLISLVGIPDFKKAFLRVAHEETRRLLTVTGIALQRYELKHRGAAPSLQALVPEFLSTVPRDCMDGQPLKYRRNTEGQFTLYSAGDDGKDDGGDSSPVKPGSRLGWREGRDAVWPLPVLPADNRGVQSSTP
jgi:hypothetical protein